MSLATEPNVATVHARVTDAFAAQDATRKARLDWIVKVGGKCHGCGATVSDAQLALHPSVCSQCHRKKHLKPLQPPTDVVETSAPQENAMPCSVCGKPGHNSRGCATRSDPKTTPAAVIQHRPAVASLPPPPSSSTARPLPRCPRRRHPAPPGPLSPARFSRRFSTTARPRSRPSPPSTPSWSAGATRSPRRSASSPRARRSA